MLGAALLLGSLAIYGQWVLAGVVEEKSNRVVELILSTVRPRHLLVGKVVGIGLLGLTQLALVAGLAAVLLAAGVYDAPSSLGRSVALVVPWFALGFALYAVAYATAGALAAQQQDANSAGQPVTYTLLAAFFVGYASAQRRRGERHRQPPYGLPPHRAARPTSAERARRRAALGAPARARTCARLDLRAHPARRARLRPRPAARGLAPARAHGLAAHPPA